MNIMNNMKAFFFHMKNASFLHMKKFSSVFLLSFAGSEARSIFAHEEVLSHLLFISGQFINEEAINRQSKGLQYHLR